MHGQAERASLRCWCRQPRGKGAAGAGERGRQVGEVERAWGRSAWRDRNSKRETPREWERQTGGERRKERQSHTEGCAGRDRDKDGGQRANTGGQGARRDGDSGTELTGGGGVGIGSWDGRAPPKLEGDAAAPQRESSPPPPSCVPVASSWCRKVPSAPAAGACRSVPPPRLLRSRCPWHGLFPSKGGFLG